MADSHRPADDNLERVEVDGDMTMWLTAAGMIRVMFETTNGRPLIFEWPPAEAARMAQLILATLHIAPIGEREFQMNLN